MNKKFLYIFGGVALGALAILIYNHKKEIKILLKEIGATLIERKRNGDETINSLIDLFLDLSYKWLTYDKLDNKAKETEKELSSLKEELNNLKAELA